MGMFDGGLTVEFDGKKNVVFRGGTTKDYPIGGMACEYARLRPYEIKEIILKYQRIGDPFRSDAMDEFFPWFDEKAREKLGYVTSGLILCDFLNIICDISKRTDEEMLEYCEGLSGENENKVKEFIFQDTQWTDFGRDTVGQAVLTAYYDFATYYAVSRTTFNILAEDGGEENRVNGFLSLYADNIDLQHIDFHIMNYDGGFHSMYTFNTAASLMLFEAANVINHDIRFVKCPNCGHYFVPEGRKDTLYCSCLSPQNSDKTCQEIGAQVARANKEKNDICTREYRKIYMRLKMAAHRHPGEKKHYQPLEELTEGNKEWKKKMSNGSATVEQYLDWIASFDDSETKRRALNGK